LLFTNDDETICQSGVICFKDVCALNGGVSIWAVGYNVVDDNASSG